MVRSKSRTLAGWYLQTVRWYLPHLKWVFPQLTQLIQKLASQVSLDTVKLAIHISHIRAPTSVILNSLQRPQGNSIGQYWKAAALEGDGGTAGPSRPSLPLVPCQQ